MAQLTWKYQLSDYRASAVSELGTYRVIGGPEQRWVALFIPFATSANTTLSEAFPACNFATLSAAVRTCVVHAERCMKITC